MQAGELNGELGGYDMASYVDGQEVGNIERELDTNLREVETEVSEYIGEYGQYITDVYKAAGDNITAIQGSVGDAQEQSEKLLTEGLEEAKVSRSGNNKLNSLLLGELSQKLPYTRIGGVENEEVYGFMASPLQLEEKEPELQMSDTVKQETDMKTEIDQTMAPVVIFILICIIVLAGIIAGAVSAGRMKRRMHEF